MYRSRTPLRLGMPHTRSHALSEVALLSHAADMRWTDLGTVTGMPASRQRDAAGNPVYASFFYAEIAHLPPSGLAAFQPDDELEVVSSLGRFGRSMLDGEHRLHPAATLPRELPEELPAAPLVRLSNVLVAMGGDAADLKIATPVNANMDAIPSLPSEPDSYRIIKQARHAGHFFPTPDGAQELWPGPYQHEHEVDPDRDLNGVGLLYFCNYVEFMDVAERRALESAATLAPETIDGRVTLRRRIGFYGNARARETLVLESEGHLLPTTAGESQRILIHHRIRRRGDDRLIAVSSVEKALR